ncbi:MAG: hypothetical protein ACE5HM_03335 [Acidiferrobacterales bacterium]
MTTAFRYRSSWSCNDLALGLPYDRVEAVCAEKTNIDRLQRQAEEIRADIKHLDQVEDVLDAARGEFKHELRRAGDALVRAGGRSWGVENRIKELKGNIALNRKDLEENKKRRQELETCLKKIEQQLS